MWTRADVREKGKAAFKRNYWKCVLAGLLTMIFSGGGFSYHINQSEKDSGEEISARVSQLSEEQLLIVAGIVLGVILFAVLIGLAVQVFLGNPFRVGCLHFYRENLEAPANLGELLSGFENGYLHTVGTMFLTGFYNTLWYCLFIIPGIVKGFSYMMVPYILKDRPELSANEAITLSRQMMDGNKMKALMLYLSFLGWILLGIITLGLGLVFYTLPYMCSTEAALYETIKAEKLERLV